MSVIDWLLDSDPDPLQAMRDLTDARPDEVAAERSRVATEGWGARLLSLQGEDGMWAGAACFPARYFREPTGTRASPGPPRCRHSSCCGTSASIPRTTASAARRRGEEYLLEPKLFRRKSTGEVVDPDWLRFSFPTRWSYDVLRALDYFRSAGDTPDTRVHEAIELVRSKQRPDGTWPLENTHPGKVHFALEDGDGQPSRWNTLRALRVLRWEAQARGG